VTKFETKNNKKLLDGCIGWTEKMTNEKWKTRKKRNRGAEIVSNTVEL